MFRFCTSVALLLVSVTAVAPGARAQGGGRDPVTDTIPRIIARANLREANRSDFGEFRRALEQLYALTGDRPIWSINGRATTQAGNVARALTSADVIGLAPEEYDASALRARAVAMADRGSHTAEEEASFDVWLSLALMRYMQHAHRGRVDPLKLRLALPAARKRLDLAELVLATSRAADVAERLATLEPRFSRYLLLKSVHAKYRMLAADTSLRPPPLASGSVRPGESYAGALMLRRWLLALGDLSSEVPAPAAEAFAAVYDSALAVGVRHFQSRHGLDVDGVLGVATFEELRRPLAQRVRQIELALERWRWIPDDTSERFIVVNIPEFRVRVFARDSSGDRPIVTMDAIVGEARRRRYTPVFMATMQYVVFRPYWDVPSRIARNEEIPKIARRPGYFASQDMEIVRGYDEQVVRYPPTPQNLAKVEAGALRLRQRPGEKNALGLVKFVFPNAYSTYLHGTPAQSLFARSRRDFSHGCMRVSDPPRLAEAVLERQGGWDRARIDSVMHGQRTVRVNLDHPIPVHVLYLTAMPDDSGDVHFSRDIYGHDAALVRALAARAAR